MSQLSLEDKLARDKRIADMIENGNSVHFILQQMRDAFGMCSEQTVKKVRSSLLKGKQKQAAPLDVAAALAPHVDALGKLMRRRGIPSITVQDTGCYELQDKAKINRGHSARRPVSPGPRATARV